MDKELKVALIIGVAVLVLVVVVCVFSWHQEAATFRKLTGRTDVTWWDAIWVNLRVTE